LPIVVRLCGKITCAAKQGGDKESVCKHDVELFCRKGPKVRAGAQCRG